MESFKASGTYTKQAHVKIPDGMYEEEHGRKGFFGRVSHLYHANKLTSWSNVEGNLKPRNLAPSFDKVPAESFICFLENNDCKIYFGNYKTTMKNFYRNADFDELFFFHEGAGHLETTYGHVPFKKGDYVVMPRGTTYKLFVNTACKILKVESNSEFEEPTRGILGPNALYDQTAIFVPEAKVGSEQNLKEYKVDIKREDEITTVTYPFNPLDVKGWKGSVYPWRISIYDYCPVISHRYHMPPSAHTTFLCQNFIVCSFVARPLEDTSEGVLKVPFYHANIDYDEVLFYHEGNFFSRDNIGAGAITFHPQGIHHGPHPNAFKKANDKTHTDEFAVMIDTKNPLRVTKWFLEIENKNYYMSWKENA